MSTVIDPETIAVRDPENLNLIGGPMPAGFDIDKLADPKVMAELLYRSKLLTDENYEELVDDVGGRAARLILRAKAISGDVRALDIYLRVVQEAKARRQKPKKQAERDVTPTQQFKPGTRDKAE